MKTTKKATYELEQAVIRQIQEYARNHDMTASGVINETLAAIISLSPEMNESLADFCYDNWRDACGKMQGAASFSDQQQIIEVAHWRSLFNLFNRKGSRCNFGHKMRTIFIEDGYVIFPNNWIVLDGVEDIPEKCRYAGVVECRNGDLYGLNGEGFPHFLFFTRTAKYGRDYSKELENTVYSACDKVYPQFMKVKDKEPTKEEWDKCKGDDAESILLAQELLRRPQIGLFNLPEKDDPVYWMSERNYIPPYGAMVVRNGE